MFVRSVITAAGLVVLLSRAALAQAPAPAGTPFRPVFGGALPDTAAPVNLNVTLNVAEAYDDNLLAEGGSVSPSPLQLSGFYTSIAPQVSFAGRAKSTQVFVTGTSSARRYPGSHDIVFTSHALGAGVSAQFTRKTSMSVNQSVTYAPSYLYGLFASVGPIEPGSTSLAAPDYAVDNVRSYAYGTTASLVHEITPRASVSFDGAYQYADIAGSPTGPSNLRSYDAGGRFSYSLNRHATLRLGYKYRNAEYSRFLRPTQQELDLGIDYSRPLSRTRRTSFGFSAGPTRIDGASAVSSAGAVDEGGRYRMTGSASLNRQYGRTWNLQGGYQRGLAFIEGLEGPAYTDAATVTAGGFFNRRVDLTLSGAFSSGELMLVGAASRFVTYTGSARWRVAIGRISAAYVEYLLYSYDFGDVALPVGVPSTLTRNSVRVGVTLWVPVMEK